MPAERAGYTVTMFLVDVSSSMGNTRQVQVPGPPGGEPEIIEMTNLEWSIQYVMLKIQEMIFNGRKTDKCGVILIGTEGTGNIINAENEGYEHITEYVPIAQPNHSTLAKLVALEPSSVVGDPIDALIVAIETQDRFLEKKKTWTRKIVLLTDGESPMEIEDWEATTSKMNALNISLTVVGVDFDDDDFPFEEENKSEIKRQNEVFWTKFTSKLDWGVVGNCDYALQEISRPDVRQVKSTMMTTTLRIGDVEVRGEEAVEIMVKYSKCTALARPKGFKRFARRLPKKGEEAEKYMELDEDRHYFAQLHMRSDYYVDTRPDGADRDGDDAQKGKQSKDEDDETLLLESSTDDPAMDAARDQAHEDAFKGMTRTAKEELVRGYKYGASFAPAPEGDFPRLSTRRGIDVCGFFPQRGFRREMAIGEVYYVWGDPASPMQQVALSAVVQAMYQKGAMAIARWVSRDNADPKMGVLQPCVFAEVDALMWVQMPFADDVRNYPFASLETLINKKGEIVTEHPYLPTNEQMDAMEEFVDAMDLTDAGEKNEEGEREPWFDTRLSYNPAIHRTKQAQFHSAIVQDLNTHPLPPPHPELSKYFEPPKRVLKRARKAIDHCKTAFNVREVPKKVVRTRKEEHVRAPDEDEDMLLLDQKAPSGSGSGSRSQFARSQTQTTISSRTQAKKPTADSGSETEEEEDPDEELLLNREHKPALPTPAGSLSPRPRNDDDDMDVDQMRAPGRIVGATYPLKDFRANVKTGDLVTKAVEDLAYVIKDVISRPFAGRRTKEMLDCMRDMRKVALELDEIDAWNSFIQELRDACLDETPGNRPFWDAVKGVGRPLSFISASEASKAGGQSEISESEAQKFIQE